MMAFLTIARRLQRTHLKLFLPFPFHSLPQPSLPSHSSSNLPHQLSQAFDQTGLVPPRPHPQTPHFSTIQPSHDQTLHDPIDFSECTNEKTHQNDRLGVRKLIKAIEKADHFSSKEEAIEVLDKAGVEPKEDLVYWAIWDLREEWKLAFLVFKWGEKWGCLGGKVWALMIWVLGNHKKFSTAWCLIQELHRSSVDIRRPMLVMIDRYTSANDPSKAIETFQLMEKFRMTPDTKAFHTLLTSLCKYGNIEEAEEFMLLNRKLFPLETEGFNIILNGWCNISLDVFEAKRIWREMSKYCIIPNAASYTNMISCFSKVGNLFDSLRLYDEMKKRGWTPGIEVYNSLMYILTRENCLNEALKIMDKMKEAGFQLDSTTYNSMIVPLCESSKLEEARTVLASMIGESVGPTIETYHALLEGASVDATLEFLNLMKKAGLGPNRDSFLLMFSKFFKLKQPENALRIWEEMKRYEVLPDSAHYTLLVEGLATCGLLINARELYGEMILSGMLDDPKLKKLLNEPVQHSIRQRGEEEPFRSVRNVKKGTQIRRGKSKVIRMKRRSKQPRKGING
ncbi:hypothetical protein Vadar_006322 [Vaccinium darrowii]|uniref:Uncharacterized protein n=1 Tax=Vaccinium darrowii TaxID=229202 RepID=A0ACB7ZII3_9ERIC|nr:hypothetical protein Vadar_006322 [Vaccinium darrowii]